MGFGISSLYSGADRLLGGYLPGAHRPAHEWAADTAGDLYNDFMGISSAREANKVAQNEAQRNRDFQERMSSTAIQRAVADMKKAGLNPILAAGGGLTGGASTPAGSMASTAKAEVQGPLLDILRVVPQMMQASSSAVSSLASARQSDAGARLSDANPLHDSSYRHSLIATHLYDTEMKDYDTRMKRRLMEFLMENPVDLEKLKSEARTAHSQAEIMNARVLGEQNLQNFEQVFGSDTAKFGSMLFQLIKLMLNK